MSTSQMMDIYLLNVSRENIKFGKCQHTPKWNQHPEVYQKWIFNHHSKSWHRVRLLKVQGPLFLKVRGRVFFIKYDKMKCGIISCNIAFLKNIVGFSKFPQPNFLGNILRTNMLIIKYVWPFSRHKVLKA